mmetsp:Transcript_148426/g.377471  ORF Transcript_148426/g.377471 Transcript_148426/m.377471 type:complete len:441 (+) Transcript_148426:32-1354(+)
MATEDEGAGVVEILATTAVPAFAMALGSAAVSMTQPSEALQARLQRFSAGLLVGAVVTEIFPILRMHLLITISESAEGHDDDANRRSSHTTAVSWPNMLAAVLGFGAALLLMYSVKALDLEGESEESDDAGQIADGDTRSAGDSAAATPSLGYVWLPGSGDEESSVKLRMWTSRLQAHASSLSRLTAAPEVDREAVDEEVHGLDYLVDSARRLCRGAEPMDRCSATRLRQHVDELIKDIGLLQEMDTSQVRDVDRQLRVAGASLLRVHSLAERATFRRWGPRPPPEIKPVTEQLSLPLGLIIAVLVDAMIDGMLIGLAGSVASTSGKLMAAATTFEMGFLGYSFACSIMKAARRCTAIFTLSLPPMCMLIASTVACLSAGYVENSAAFSGLVAFAMVAVLFLVFQELLVEAHEKEDGDAWHISVWLYAGLLLSAFCDLVF